MKVSRDKDISYEVVRSRRSTADIVVERERQNRCPRTGYISR